MPSGRATAPGRYGQPAVRRTQPQAAGRIITPRQLATAAFHAGFGKRVEERSAVESFIAGATSMWSDDPKKVEIDLPQLITAVSIALAEHRGKVRLGAVSATRDLGAWQINEPTWVEGGPHFDRNRLLTDLDYNAQAAYHVFKNGRRGFGEWSTFPARAVLYRRKAAIGARNAGITRKGLEAQEIGGNLATAIDDAVSGFDFDGLAKTLWPILMKTALAGTGLALMGWGVAGLFSSSGAGAVVKSVNPVGAVVGGMVK